MVNEPDMFYHRKAQNMETSVEAEINLEEATVGCVKEKEFLIIFYFICKGPKMYTRDQKIKGE